MATWADVERIAGALPQTAPVTAWGRPAIGVSGSWFVMDRGPRADALDAQGRPEEGLILLWVADEDTKFALAADDSGYFLTTPHFAGYRMVLARLARLPREELEELLVDSWLARAPKRVAAAYHAEWERGLSEGGSSADLIAEVTAEVTAGITAGVTAEVTAEGVGAGFREEQAAIAAALGLPASAGRNLDALADALRDLPEAFPGRPGVVLHWPGAQGLHEQDPGSHELLTIVLRRAAQWHAARGWNFEVRP